MSGGDAVLGADLKPGVTASTRGNRWRGDKRILEGASRAQRSYLWPDWTWDRVVIFRAKMEKREKTAGAERTGVGRVQRAACVRGAACGSVACARGASRGFGGGGFCCYRELILALGLRCCHELQHVLGHYPENNALCGWLEIRGAANFHGDFCLIRLIIYGLKFAVMACDYLFVFRFRRCIPVEEMVVLIGTDV